MRWRHRLSEVLVMMWRDMPVIPRTSTVVVGLEQRKERSNGEHVGVLGQDHLVGIGSGNRSTAWLRHKRTREEETRIEQES